MKIEVIGSGCKKCKALFDLTVEVAKDLGIKDVVEYSTDVTKIVAMGGMTSPVLAIDGKSVLAGVLPSKEALTQVISGKMSGNSEKQKTGVEKVGGCCCGGKC